MGPHVFNVEYVSPAPETSVQGDQSAIAAGTPIPSSRIFKTELATNPPPAESPYMAMFSSEFPFLLML